MQTTNDNRMDININDLYAKSLKRKRNPYEITNLDLDLNIISAGTKKLKISNDTYINKQVYDPTSCNFAKNKMKMDKKIIKNPRMNNAFHGNSTGRNKGFNDSFSSQSSFHDISITEEPLKICHDKSETEVFLDIEHSSKLIKSAIDMEKLQINYFKFDHPSLVPTKKNAIILYDTMKTYKEGIYRKVLWNSLKMYNMNRKFQEDNDDYKFTKDEGCLYEASNDFTDFYMNEKENFSEDLTMNDIVFVNYNNNNSNNDNEYEDKYKTYKNKFDKKYEDKYESDGATYFDAMMID